MSALQELVKEEKRKRIFAIGIRGDVEKFIKYLQKEAPNCYKDSDLDDEDTTINNERRRGDNTTAITSLQKVVHQINFKYSTRGSKILQLLHQCREISADDLLLCTHKDPYYDLASSNKSEIIAASSSSSQTSLRSRSSSNNNSNGNNNNNSFPFSNSCGSASSLNNNNNNVNNNTIRKELKQIIAEVMRVQGELYAEAMKNMLQQVAAMTISSMNSDNKSSNYNSSSFPLSPQCQQLQQQSTNKHVIVGEEENDYNDSNQKQQHNQDNRTEINDNNSTTTTATIIFKRITEMIADGGIFEYPELRKALQKEGFQDQSILEVFANHRIQIDNLRNIFRQYQQPQQQYPSFIYQQGQGQQRQGQQGYGQQLLSTKEQVMIEIEDNNISTVNTVSSHIQLTQLTQQELLSVQIETEQAENKQQFMQPEEDYNKQSSSSFYTQKPQLLPTNKSEQNHYDRLEQGRRKSRSDKSPFKDIALSSRSPSPMNRRQQQQQ